MAAPRGGRRFGAEMGEIIETIIIGAGPAGLTAGYTLAKQGRDVLVLEQDPVYVGGISRTAHYKGFLFDIGGHRFFSKSKEIVDLWNEILPDDFLDRPRLSRIYYRGKFYAYPLKRLRGAEESRRRRKRALHGVLRLGQGLSGPGAAHLPSMGAQSVRRAALRHFLQDLHRKSVGHELRRHFRRLGGAAHQGPVARRARSSTGCAARWACAAAARRAPRP